MKYTIENSVVTNISMGDTISMENETVIDREEGFGNIGDWYDSVNDVCNSMIKGYEVFNTTTGQYEYDESRLDESKSVAISDINWLCDTSDANDFEYPAGSGKFYKITDAILKTLQRSAGMDVTTAIPCNNGYWDTVDGESISFTIRELQLMYNYGYDIPESNYRNKVIHLKAIDGMTTTKAVVEYDYSTGWK